MREQQSLWQFMQTHSDKLFDQTITHIGLTFVSVMLAVLIGLPLGILIAKRQSLASGVLGTANILQTIPSIALLGFMIPLLGIGPLPAIAILFIYGLLPVIRNTYTGIIGVNHTVVDAAKGMGMSWQQILYKVELPLAMPMLLAGIRTTTVINVGVATLAAYIAAGGLGEFIFGGIALNNSNMILAGAIPSALLAIGLDFLLSKLQHVNVKNLRKTAWALPVSMLLLSSFYIIPTTGNKMLAGFEPEFMGRTDGYLGLKSQYGLKISTVVISDAVMYKAAYEHKLDVIGGYSTDGRLKAYDLIVLEDDKTIFPPYYAAPVVRNQVLQRYPELETVLNLLAGTINDSIMTELNYFADHLKQTPAKVAKDFLISKGLWRPPQSGSQGTIRIGCKIFGEQYILAELYRMLIEGHSDLAVVTRTGLGGTRICFDALTNNQIDLYPEYTGTGLLVILQPSQALVDSLISNKEKVYSYVQDQFKEQFGLTWLTPIGFNNSYALMMRRAQASELKIKDISDLKKYVDENE